MRPADQLTHLKALAPLVKNGLVDRQDALDAVEAWDEAEWKDGFVKHLTQGKVYMEGEGMYATRRANI